MKESITQFLSKNFALVLLFFSLVGLLLPFSADDVAIYLLILLFVIIFSSFFKLDLSWEPLKKNLKLSIGYVLVRYMIIPLLLFWIIYIFDPFLAAAFTYLAILPPGVSSPAVTRLNSGSINLALVILMFGNLIILVSIPLLTPYIFNDTSVHSSQLLNTLLITIVLPFLTHLPFRRVPRVKKFMLNNLTLIVTFALAIMLMLAISKYRTLLFENMELIPSYLLYSFIGFLLLYTIGWLLLFFRSNKERVSASFTSGLNNIGLGISLAIIYLPSEYILFFIVCEFSWIFSLIPVRFFIRRYINK